MSERSTSIQTTTNGEVIRRPGEQLTSDQIATFMAEHHLDGGSAAARVEQFRGMSVEDVAELLDDLNKGLQGSRETLLDERTVKAGDNETIPVEYRYDLFEQLVEKLQRAPADINPARFGDAVALMTVILHPFKDGNGRTSRVLGYVFQPDFDTPNRVEDLALVAASRDEMRRNNVGFRPNGYIPRLAEGKSQSNPQDVLEYFDELLQGSDRTDTYSGTFDLSPRTV